MLRVQMFTEEKGKLKPTAVTAIHGEWLQHENLYEVGNWEGHKVYQIVWLQNVASTFCVL